MRDGTIQATQKFTSTRPCPVCGGHEGLHRKTGTRCYGYISHDGGYAHCTREEFAGQLVQNANSDTYGHWLGGTCKCGNNHRSLVAYIPTSIGNRNSRLASVPPDGSTVYEYQWGNGSPVIRVIRIIPKDFYQQHLDDSGNWVNGTGAIKPPLYRLPELIKADLQRTVLLVEGEKDTDRAVQEGFVATTNPRGAKGFQSQMVPFLAGRKILVIADNDDAGRDGANRKAEMLRAVAQSVKVIECLPGVEDINGGDLSNWFDAGHNVTELRELAESLPEWQASEHSSGFKLMNFVELLDKPDGELDWLVDGWMAVGGTSTVVAKPKVGKSTFARNLSLSVARGSDFLGRRTEQGPVIYLALEETERRVREQFRRIGATGEEPIYTYVGPTPAQLFEEILPHMKSIQPKLVVLDPLFRAVRVKDSSAYAEVTNALDPILRLAASTGCHVLVPHHAGKQAREAVDSALGSTAIAGTFDSIFVLNKRDDTRTIEVVLREGDPIPRTVLSMDAETERISLAGSVEEADLEKIGEAILEVTADTWLSEPEITGAVEGATARKRRVLRELVKTGRLVREGTGKRGDPYAYSGNLFSCSTPYVGTREQETSELESIDSAPDQFKLGEQEKNQSEDSFIFDWDTGLPEENHIDGEVQISTEPDNETLNVTESKANVGNIVGAIKKSGANQRESEASPSDCMSQALEKTLKSNRLNGGK
jgi:hypothetical protein